jgi:hypothetical protein
MPLIPCALGQAACRTGRTSESRRTSPVSASIMISRISSVAGIEAGGFGVEE